MEHPERPTDRDQPADRHPVSDPRPPSDPRASWDLPSLGTLPTVSRLDEVSTRVLAANPSPMTLDGTNTYVLSSSGSGQAVVVDPGPPLDAHLEAVEGVLAGLDVEVRSIVVTHHHLDHSEAAGAWGRRFGVDVLASTTDVARARDGGEATSCCLAEGDRVPLDGLEIEVVPTPGHTRDHLALRLGTGVMLTGDHVLGRGTSVVAHPDGDLAAYLESLSRVLRIGPDALYPGHGPELTEDPTAVLHFYRDHRRFREAQILTALGEGPARPRQLVERIYADVDRGLWGAAEASTRAALEMLSTEGRIRYAGDEAALADT